MAQCNFKKKQKTNKNTKNKQKTNQTNKNKKQKAKYCKCNTLKDTS